ASCSRAAALPVGAARATRSGPATSWSTANSRATGVVLPVPGPPVRAVSRPATAAAAASRCRGAAGGCRGGSGAPGDGAQRGAGGGRGQPLSRVGGVLPGVVGVAGEAPLPAPGQPGGVHRQGRAGEPGVDLAAHEQLVAPVPVEVEPPPDPAHRPV